MRTVSFSDKALQSALAENFLSTFTNTKGDPSAGASFSHSPNDPPGPCGKAAGRQNVQCIFMTRRGEIFHVVGGFQSADDLVKELKFAQKLFDEIQTSSDPKQQVANTHTQFLRSQGFTDSQIRTGQVGMFNENMPNFSPKDLGIEMPGMSNQIFDQMHRYRVLADHRYLIQNPLITKTEFERAPEKLVGRQKSFFGSNAAMNAANSMFNNDRQSQKDLQQNSARDGQRRFQFNFDRGRGFRFDR